MRTKQIYTLRDSRSRFFSKITKLKNGCWKWKGSLTSQGYSQFYFNGAMTTGHRFSYRLSRGEIPSDLFLDHLCRNRWCSNPKHLEAVSAKENILRGNGITAMNARKTHCNHGHSLSGDNLEVVTERRCRACSSRRSTETAKRRKLLGV